MGENFLATAANYEQDIHRIKELFGSEYLHQIFAIEYLPCLHTTFVNNADEKCQCWSSQDQFTQTVRRKVED